MALFFTSCHQGRGPPHKTLHCCCSDDCETLSTLHSSGEKYLQKLEHCHLKVTLPAPHCVGNIFFNSKTFPRDCTLIDAKDRWSGRVILVRVLGRSSILSVYFFGFFIFLFTFRLLNPRQNSFRLPTVLVVV